MVTIKKKTTTCLSATLLQRKQLCQWRPECSQSLKEEGNKQFKNEDYERAIDTYNSGISHILKLYSKVDQDKQRITEKVTESPLEGQDLKVTPDASISSTNPNHPSSSFEDEDEEGVPSQPTLPVEERENNGKEYSDEAREALSILYGNIATCFWKKHEYLECVKNANQSLSFNGNYHKALYRRALGNEKLNTWNSLLAAQKDFEALLETELYKAVAQTALQSLPQRITNAQKQEKEEMLGKLKELGNSFLGKFGMSLDNFKMTTDPSTGASSIQYASPKH